MAGKKGQHQPSRLLRDYRKVHENPQPDPADTPMLRKIKDQFHNDFDKFIARYERLETQHKDRKSDAATNSGSESWASPDVGEENAMRVLEEWLRENGTDGSTPAPSPSGPKAT